MTVRHDLLEQLADVLAWPLLLLSPEGELMHANHAARQLLAQRSALMLDAQQLVDASQARRRPAFRKALQEAAAAPPGAHPTMLHWPGASGSATLVFSRLHQAGSASAVLLALSPARSAQAEVQVFAGLHGLSEAETRVLHRLALGEGSVEAARALAVSAATVRSQVVSLRKKTGHSSVADLLRALASMPPLMPAGQSAARAGANGGHRR
jgi:DNA-binding CsgD family transcriptional regulator